MTSQITGKGIPKVTDELQEPVNSSSCVQAVQGTPEPGSLRIQIAGWAESLPWTPLLDCCREVKTSNKLVHQDVYRETRSPKPRWVELTNEQPVLCQKCAKCLSEVAIV